MSYTILSSEDHSHTTLSNFNFSALQKTLENTKFIDSTLKRVNFSKMTLTNVDFTNARLINVDFTGTKLINVDFTHATFKKTNLNNVNFINTSFENANLEKVKCDIPIIQKFLIFLSSLIIGIFSGFTSTIVFNSCHYFFQGQYNPWLSGLFSFFYIVFTRLIIIFYVIPKNPHHIMDLWIYTGVLLIVFVGIAMPFAIENLKPLDNKKDININNTKQSGSSNNVSMVCIFVVVIDIIFILISQIPKYNLNSDLVTLLRVVIASFLGTIAGTIISRESIINKNPKFIWLWNTFVHYACINGTKFKNCNLKSANFSGANFKGCTFTLTNSNIINTKWCHIKQIDSCIIIGSYLANSEIQELLTKQNGTDKNFDNLELPGLYLFEANLEEASFINSNLSYSVLSKAKLKGAKFEKTRLNYADLSNAKLTGIRIASRSVPLTTVLDNIECFHCYPHSNPDIRYPLDQKDLTSEQAINYLQEKSPRILTFENKKIDWEAFSQAVQISLKELKIPLERGNNLIQSLEETEDNLKIKLNLISDINEAELLNKIDEEYKKEQTKNIEYINSLDNVIFNLANVQYIKYYINTINLNQVEKQNYTLNQPLFGGGFSGDFGKTVGGHLNNDTSNINVTEAQNLTEAIIRIEQQLNELKTKGYTIKKAQEKTAQNLTKNANNNPKFSAKMTIWRLELQDNLLDKATINEEVMEVFKLSWTLLE